MYVALPRLLCLRLCLSSPLGPKRKRPGDDTSRGSKLARKGERGDTRDRRYLCVYCVYCVVLVLVHVHSYVLMTALAVAREDLLVGLSWSVCRV